MNFDTRTMKTRLGQTILLLFFLSAWTTAKSQQVHYHLTEDFSSFPSVTNPFPYKGWSNTLLYGDRGTDFWSFGNPGGRTVSAPGSGEVAIFDADNYSFNWDDDDAALTTPFFDTRGYDSVWVKFDQQFEYNGSGGWELDAFDGRSWVTVSSGAAQINWQTDSVDITDYCANLKNARFRFRWMGTWQNNRWWMIDNIQIYSPVKANNVTVVNATFQNGQCGNSNDKLQVTVRNVSDAALSNIPVKGFITGVIGGIPVTTTVSGTLAGPLSPGAEANVSIGSINTVDGGTVEFKAYPEFAGDPNTDNDTFFMKSYTILGTPASTTNTVFFRCGAGKVLLDGGIQKGNVGYWYYTPNPTVNSHFSTSDQVSTDFLTAPSSQTVFLAQARRSSTTFDLSNGYNGNTFVGKGQYVGNMFSVTAVSNIEINTLGVHMPNNNNANVLVYFKTGTYEGFESDATAWTFLDSVDVTGQGFGSETRVPIKELLIPAGQKYSLMVLSSDDMVASSGITTTTNDDIVIETGNMIFDKFVAYQNDYSWDGTVYYNTYCESNRTPITGVAKEAPSFSGFTANTQFKGFFRDGTEKVPDLVASPDNIIYNIITPLGFLSSNHGPSGTWEIINVDFSTVNGTPVPKADFVYTAPSSAGDGRFSYTPSTGYTDSTVKLSLIIRRFDDQCDTVIERVIYVAPRPDPKFTISNGCKDQVVSISNTSSILAGTISHKWDFGDGTTSTYINPVKSYSLPGTYTIKLVINSALGYADSLTKTIDVFQIPGTNFSFTNACEGTAVTMTDKTTLPSGTATYTWDFGTTPASGSAQQSPSKMYNTPGIYKVTLTVAVNGCSATVSKNVTQAPRVTPDFNFTAAQCDNGDINFTNTTANPSLGTVSYLWKFGDGSQSTAASTNHTYNNFTPFNVVLIGNTSLGCKDSVTKTVVMRQSPAATFTTSAGTCSNDPIDFTNTSVVPAGFVNTYKWSFGDGNTATTDNATHQFDAPGVYKVVLESSSTNGCDGRIEIPVTIKLKPTADYTAIDVCEGEQTVFTNNSVSADASALTYAWDLGNTTTSTVTNPSVKYATAGSYTVTLQATHTNGCVDTKTSTVKVNAVPTVNIIGTSGKGGDGSFSFATSAAGTGYTYLWQFGDGGSSTVQNPQYTYLGDGKWTVTLKVTTPEGCSATSTETAWINRLGINNAEGLANAVSVYPNPTSGRFVIDFTKTTTEDISAIYITDMLGRTLESNITIPVSGVAEVDLSGQAAGIYYLNIATAAGRHTVKITVSK